MLITRRSALAGLHLGLVNRLVAVEGAPCTSLNSWLILLTVIDLACKRSPAEHDKPPSNNLVTKLAAGLLSNPLYLHVQNVQRKQA
jgi:hypothetical protein